MQINHSHFSWVFHLCRELGYSGITAAFLFQINVGMMWPSGAPGSWMCKMLWKPQWAKWAMEVSITFTENISKQVRSWEFAEICSQLKPGVCSCLDRKPNDLSCSHFEVRSDIRQLWPIHTLIFTRFIHCTSRLISWTTSSSQVVKND